MLRTLTALSLTGDMQMFVIQVAALTRSSSASAHLRISPYPIAQRAFRTTANSLLVKSVHGQVMYECSAEKPL
jgi:hypothetical protein